MTISKFGESISLETPVYTSVGATNCNTTFEDSVAGKFIKTHKQNGRNYTETQKKTFQHPGTPSVLFFLGNFTPKTNNYCLKNKALGFPGQR